MWISLGLAIFSIAKIFKLLHAPFKNFFSGPNFVHIFIRKNDQTLAGSPGFWEKVGILFSG